MLKYDTDIMGAGRNLTNLNWPNKVSDAYIGAGQDLTYDDLVSEWWPNKVNDVYIGAGRDVTYLVSDDVVSE